MATYVYAETTPMAKRWCRENGVKPFAKDTYLVTGGNCFRGRLITGEDRVVLVGDVAGRDDWQRVCRAIAPALTDTAVIERDWLPPIVA